LSGRISHPEGSSQQPCLRSTPELGKRKESGRESACDHTILNQAHASKKERFHFRSLSHAQILAEGKVDISSHFGEVASRISNLDLFYFASQQSSLDATCFEKDGQPDKIECHLSAISASLPSFKITNFNMWINPPHEKFDF
jgi:hypothetical protein